MSPHAGIATDRVATIVASLYGSARPRADSFSSRSRSRPAVRTTSLSQEWRCS